MIQAGSVSRADATGVAAGASWSSTQLRMVSRRSTTSPPPLPVVAISTAGLLP